MKLSSRDKQLLLIVGGLIITLCVYYFVFLNLQGKTEELQAENAVLENVIGQLKELDKNREQYITDTENYKVSSEEIKDKFPAGVEEEDDILHIDGLEGTLSEYYASSVGMPSAVGYELAYPPVETISVDDMLAGNAAATDETTETTDATTTDAAVEGTEDTSVDGATLSAATGASNIKLWYVPVTTNYEVNYISLKQLIKAISEDSNKKSIEEVALTYSEDEGILTGTMVANYYYLSGTDKAYNTPEVLGVPVGTSNPFRSVR